MTNLVIRNFDERSLGSEPWKSTRWEVFRAPELFLTLIEHHNKARAIDFASITCLIIHKPENECRGPVRRWPFAPLIRGELQAPRLNLRNRECTAAATKKASLVCNEHGYTTSGDLRVKHTKSRRRHSTPA
jgi:hypothetical protein